MADGLMPAAFFGHGNPMNALEVNRYTAAWQAFGAAVPRPRAILVVSAHWYINATAVTAMPRPRTIHDFYGFPPELFDVQYPAPGLPELAAEISDVVHPTWVGADVDSWGIDHGTWSVLVHAFPDASIPVVQLSINADKPLDYHLELGAKLAPLRERGVLDRRQRQRRAQPARDGLEARRRRLRLGPALRRGRQGPHADRPDRVRDARRAPRLPPRRADPRPLHPGALPRRPGRRRRRRRTTEVLVDGYAYGSLSMTAYTLGLPCPTSGGGPASPQPPADLPPDGSNI